MKMSLVFARDGMTAGICEVAGAVAGWVHGVAEDIVVGGVVRLGGGAASTAGRDGLSMLSASD